jgi:sirohydrochlorin ferrochelatase
MKCLLLVAHGSRREASNDEVKQLAAQIRQHGAFDFDEIEVAFLELAQPSVADVADCCVARGVTDIVVFPYFLAAGRHVSKDIPDVLAPVLEKYPHLNVHVTQHLGTSGKLADAVLAIANN